MIQLSKGNTNVVQTEPSGELVIIGDYSVPYQMDLEQFEQFPVSAEQASTRQKIYNLQYIMEHQLHEFDTMDQLVPIHRFTPGIYTRELTIPKDMIVVGKRHGREHIVMLITGKCRVVTEHSDEILQAPCTFISAAGEKRVVYTLEETTWVTIHRTNGTDMEQVEADLIIAEPDYAKHVPEHVKQLKWSTSQQLLANVLGDSAATT